MHIRRRTAAAVATLATAALAGGALIGTATADAGSPGKVPVVVAHMSSKSIKLSTGATMHAGRVMFRVQTGQGHHFLQLGKLHHGYSPQQAGADIGKAFQGNVAAVRRIDKNITFRGGAEARPHHPGRFGTTLPAGTYLLVDQDGNAHSLLHVVGKTPVRAAIPHQNNIVTYTYGFGTSPRRLAKSGWVSVKDRSDQPHFVELQHVKAGTTSTMVRRYFKSGARGEPSFALKGSTGSGVISPNTGEVLHYDLPAGKYLVACFWPDDDTGMPHAFMGMWKLIWLT